MIGCNRKREREEGASKDVVDAIWVLAKEIEWKRGKREGGNMKEGMLAQRCK